MIRGLSDADRDHIMANQSMTLMEAVSATLNQKDFPEPGPSRRLASSPPPVSIQGKTSSPLPVHDLQTTSSHQRATIFPPNLHQMRDFQSKPDTMSHLSSKRAHSSHMPPKFYRNPLPMNLQTHDDHSGLQSSLRIPLQTNRGEPYRGTNSPTPALPYLRRGPALAPSMHVETVTGSVDGVHPIRPSSSSESKDGHP